jgi:hypothetical protein
MDRAWAMVRLDVRVTAPDDVVLIEGRLINDAPAELQEPFASAMEKVVDGFNFESFRLTEPEPVVKSWIVADPLAPPFPILALQLAATVAAEAGMADTWTNAMTIADTTAKRCNLELIFQYLDKAHLLRE